MIKQIIPQQKTTQRTTQNLVGAIPLCSKCIIHEVDNWIADKRGAIEQEVAQKVREELKTIRLIQGECVVCNHNLISGETIENIIKIFEKKKIDQKTLEEFKRLFGFIE